MSSTPIFDALHREFDAPPIRFMEPDGSLICYGVLIYPHGEPHNYALEIKGPAPL
jgi:hypothetical protein